MHQQLHGNILRTVVSPWARYVWRRAVQAFVLAALQAVLEPAAQIAFAQELLALPGLPLQLTGLRFMRSLCKLPGPAADAMALIAGEFTVSLMRHLSEEGPGLARKVAAIKVETKAPLVEALGHLISMAPKANHAEICIFWGELGLKCICAGDERTRDIGIGLLESLNGTRHIYPATALAPAAKRALVWLQDLFLEPNEGTMGGPASLAEEAALPGPERKKAQALLVKHLEGVRLKDAEKLGDLLRSVLEALTMVGAATDAKAVPKLYFNAAIRCLRCAGKYPIREMGVQMLMQIYRNVEYWPKVTKAATWIDAEKYMRCPAGVTAVLESIFGEAYAHHAVIRLASPWLVETFYLNFAYKNDEVDMMVFLVTSAVHSTDPDTVKAATDLLIKITLIDSGGASISIVSLNSLCSLFKEAVSTKATAAAGTRLILAWIDKTRKMQWNIHVQEQVLSFLYAILVHKSADNEEDTAKVLDYFKSQFDSIRDDAGSVARGCILKCAQDCLAEIQRSAAATAGQAAGLVAAKTPSLAELPPSLPPPLRAATSSSEALAAEPFELRSRATQAARLFTIIMAKVDRLRPVVLRSLTHEEGVASDPLSVVEGLLSEVLAVCAPDDVDACDVLHRLELIGTLCSFQLDRCPLTLRMVEKLWESLVVKHSRHRAMALKWLRVVLRPTAGYFAAGPSEAEARAFCLRGFEELLVGVSRTPLVLDLEGCECLLSLFLWVNKDKGNITAAEGGKGTILQVFERLAMTNYDELDAFSALVVAALDRNPALPATKLAAEALLLVGSEVYRTLLTRDQETLDEHAKKSIGLVRYKLLNEVKWRITGEVAKSARQDGALLVHWLDVLRRLVDGTKELGELREPILLRSPSAEDRDDEAYAKVLSMDGSDEAPVQVVPLGRQFSANRNPPSARISTSDETVDALFSLLDRLDDVSAAAWRVLEMAPAVASLKEKVRNPLEVSWPDLLGPSAPLWRRVYVCRIIKDRLAEAAWGAGFVGSGGTHALFRVLSDVGAQSLLQLMRVRALEPFLAAIDHCLRAALAGGGDGGGDGAATLSAVDPVSVNLAAAMDLLFKIVGAGAEALSGASATEDAEAARSTLTACLIMVTTIVQETTDEAWAPVATSFQTEVMFELLLEAPDQGLRAKAQGAFVALLAVAGKNRLAPSAAEALAPLFFGGRLTALPCDSTTAAEYFAVCHELLALGEQEWLDAPTLAAGLTAKLRSFAAPLDKPDGSDSVLVGTLQTLAALVAVQPACLSLPDAEALLDLVFHVLLMRLPYSASPAALTGAPPPPDASKGPVCGTDDARAAACDLLAGLRGVAPALGERLAGLIADFAVLAPPPLPRPAALPPMGAPAEDGLRTHDRPGLKNTANRCYMNSLTQQLTALDAFSSDLLAAPVPDSVLEVDAAEAARETEKEKSEPGQDAPAAGTWACPVCTVENDAALGACNVCGSAKPANVKVTAPGVDPEVERRELAAAAKAQKVILREMQRTVRFLRHGDMSYFDAEPLLHKVGKHLALQFPAKQQNDTKEYMDKLLDRLELELSDGEGRHKDVIKRSFGATTAETKVRQRDKKEVDRNAQATTTYTLQLQVEGIGSLEEAMAKNFEAQVRHVDDEDDVDEATGKPKKAKFDYTQVLVEPPAVLCVQLSRFSFDYSRGVPIKHNHRVSFGQELDIGKYTEAGAPCRYRLRGVLVHQGASANSGHYYSIIRSASNGDEFLKYNDSHVSVAESLEDECFGGKRTGADAKKFGGREKSWNAYLLFYERWHCEDEASTSGGAGALDGEAAAKAVAAKAVAAKAVAALSADDGVGCCAGSTVLAAQRREVQQANAELWRRKLLYTDPIARLAKTLRESTPEVTAASATSLDVLIEWLDREQHPKLTDGQASKDGGQASGTMDMLQGAWFNSVGQPIEVYAESCFISRRCHRISRNDKSGIIEMNGYELQECSADFAVWKPSFLNDPKEADFVAWQRTRLS